MPARLNRPACGLPCGQGQRSRGAGSHARRDPTAQAPGTRIDCRKPVLGGPAVCTLGDACQTRPAINRTTGARADREPRVRHGHGPVPRSASGRVPQWAVEEARAAAGPRFPPGPPAPGEKPRRRRNGRGMAPSGRAAQFRGGSGDRGGPLCIHRFPGKPRHAGAAVEPAVVRCSAPRAWRRPQSHWAPRRRRRIPRHTSCTVAGQEAKIRGLRSLPADPLRHPPGRCAGGRRKARPRGGRGRIRGQRPPVRLRRHHHRGPFRAANPVPARALRQTLGARAGYVVVAGRDPGLGGGRRRAGRQFLHFGARARPLSSLPARSISTDPTWPR